MEYNVKRIKAPRLAGRTLRTFTKIVEHPLLGRPIRNQMRMQVGLDELNDAKAFGESPERPAFKERASDHPSISERHGADLQMAEEAVFTPAMVPDSSESFRFTSISDYTEAYRDKRLTPEDVAQRVIDATLKSDADSPSLRVFIAQDVEDLKSQAAASAERHARGQQLSVLDGVPIAVKDEIDMTPYPTTVGTSFLGKQNAERDGAIVEKLRAAGALLIGKANMHELGLGVSGINPHHGTARNPYHPSHVTGGSSSGSAAAVASGLCPVAIGADGGGSIRIPSSLCGMVGLKPTYGRVSEDGAAPLCWSVAHLGPIGATAKDVAAVYGLIAGPDVRDPGTVVQPPPHLEGFARTDLKGVRLGVFRPWFDDADDVVRSSCAVGVEGLKAAGAEIIDIAVPDLHLIKLAHLVIISTEMVNARLVDAASDRGRYGHDVRINFALAREISAAQYIQARRVRSRMIHQIDELLDSIDGIVTPTTGCTAPPIRPSALESGESDLSTLDKVMRFAPLPNLTGLPAITFPVGYDDHGLPVGLQVIGRAWQEAGLLSIARVAEGFNVRREPMRHYPIL